MNFTAAIAEIDAQMEKLTSAREALVLLQGGNQKKRRRGRRKMSAAARARISKAMKLRWSQRKKAA